MGPNNWGIFLILPVTTGEGIGPAGDIFPVVCMLKNGLTEVEVDLGEAIPVLQQKPGKYKGPVIELRLI